MAEVIECSKERDADWFSEGYPALQSKLEISADDGVTVSVSRYEELIRAEHTAELIKRAYEEKAFKYDSERTAAVKLLLGMEIKDE